MLMNLKNFTLRSERLLVIALLACSTPHAFAISMVSEDSHNPVVNQQDTHVKGTVIDSRTGEPIIGANIVVKGTTNGTITGVDGDYSLKAPVGSVLEISFIGYKTVTVKAVAGLQKIRLQEDSSLLDEVVVVGYGTQKKVNLSGAVDAISSEALEDRPIINAGQGLQGVIPNLNITISNGAANSTPSFNIRGETSLNGGDPLILVDNIPTTSGELSRLNTNDIESVSVLKDAASAAIYGARAAFGVILVTTKRAKSEKIAINVNAFYSTRKVTRVPEHVTDPYTVMKIKHDAATPLYNLYPEKQLEIGKYFSEHPNEDRVVINPDDPESWLYYGSTDWMDEVYESSAPSYTVNFNISQKAKKTSYYLSGEYARQDGMLRYGNDIYDRYNIRGKVDFQITNWLNLSNNTSFVQRTYDQPSFGRTDWGLSDFFHEVNRTNSLDVPRNPDGSWTQSGGAILGALQEGGRKINDSREFSTTFGLTLDIIKDMWQIKADATWRRDSELNRNSYHNYHYKTGPNKPEQASGRPTRASRSTSFYNYNVYNVYTDFHYTFADKHYVQALLGFNQETRKTNSFSMYRDDLISSSFPTPELAVGEKGIGEDISEWAVRGMFFRVNYIYDDKYILKRAIESVDGNTSLKQNLKEKLYKVYDYEILSEIVVRSGIADNVHNLYEAVKDKRQVAFHEYKSSNSHAVTDRVVEPFAFTANNNEIWCYEPASGKNKLFKVSRITSVEVLETGWQFEESHEEGYTDVFHISSDRRLPVTLRLGMTAANLLIEEFPLAEKYMEREDDAHWLFHTEVCKYEGIGRFVLGLFEDIEIINSPDFVLYLKEKVQNISEKIQD